LIISFIKKAIILIEIIAMIASMMIVKMSISILFPFRFLVLSRSGRFVVFEKTLSFRHPAFIEAGFCFKPF